MGFPVDLHEADVGTVFRGRVGPGFADEDGGHDERIDTEQGSRLKDVVRVLLGLFRPEVPVHAGKKGRDGLALGNLLGGLRGRLLLDDGFLLHDDDRGLVGIVKGRRVEFLGIRRTPGKGKCEDQEQKGQGAFHRSSPLSRLKE